VLPLASILAFFLLLEGALALFGIKPVLKTEDPFVGFASNAPLFVPAPGPRGDQWLLTAQNKRGYFNVQGFPQTKAPGTYRIFTLGGSTTYGRPYDDKTSFSGWLRELLPMADSSRDWEVINAGGISYASYRVAHLMEELINYQPDIFIIYTGDNEFLEDRTYGQIRDMSPLVKNTVSVLNKTRTWAAMNSAMRSLGLQAQEEEQNRDTLGDRVDTILDLTVGLGQYRRDDALRENILKHYRLSLERMVALARSVDAEVIFVSPASSQNDCTPFKSQHTPGLDPAAQRRSEQMLAQAKDTLRTEDWQKALGILETAAAADPRHAELQYRRGQALLAMGRYEEAKDAFRIASDEDVCPLRALTPMNQILKNVASEERVALVDYVDILERQMQAKKGYPIPGAELFLDHVHPTIEGHKILAVALVDEMINHGMVQPGANWNDRAIAKVAAIIEGQIDSETHGQALANLARVLLWAGKLEDAARSARLAQETAGDIRQVAVDSASILSSIYVRQGQLERAMQLLYATLAKAPGAIELHLKLAENLLEPQFLQLEKAAASFLLVTQQMPSFDRGHSLYGYTMSKRGRLDVAYASLLEALRLNPNNTRAKATLPKIRQMMGSQTANPQLAQPMLSLYPSQAPMTLSQMRRTADGRFVIDGIKVEFHENGRLKSFADMSKGTLNGFEMTWDSHGRLLSRQAYQNGSPVDLKPGT
jgi:tetratricopeptide (TPR) repeat protein